MSDTLDLQFRSVKRTTRYSNTLRQVSVSFISYVAVAKCRNSVVTTRPVRVTVPCHCCRLHLESSPANSTTEDHRRSVCSQSRTASQLRVMAVCSDCIKGSLDQGTPKGQDQELTGVPCYVTHHAVDAANECAIVLAPDVFGYQLINARLIADIYAAAGYICVVPDYFQGEACDVKLLETYESLRTKSFFGKVITGLHLLLLAARQPLVSPRRGRVSIQLAGTEHRGGTPICKTWSAAKGKPSCFATAWRLQGEIESAGLMIQQGCGSSSRGSLLTVLSVAGDSGLPWPHCACQASWTSLIGPTPHQLKAL